MRTIYRSHRTRMPALTVMLTVLLLAATSLSGCGLFEDGPPTGTADIVVDGDFAAPVIISMPKNFQEPTELESRVLIEGDGDEIIEGQPVLLRMTSFDSVTGKVISEYGEGTLHSTYANDEGLAEFAPLVIGKKEGTRLLIARPEKVKNKSVSEIVVMDILHSTARGESKDPSEYATEIIPEVTFLEDRGPQVHTQGKRIDKLSTHVLTSASGAQVDVDQKIAIQYVITDGQGNVIDSTWETRRPSVVSLNKMMRGLQEGLEDQKVGSRVLIVIPSSLAKGDGDRIAVVDILAAETKQEPKKK